MKYSSFLIAILFAATSLLLVQCGESSDDSATERFEEERSELVSNLESLRDDIDEQLEELGSRIDAAGDEADESLTNAYDELRGERSELDRAIDDVERASEDTWASVKSGAEDAYDAVSSTFNDWMEDLDDLF